MNLPIPKNKSVIIFSSYRTKSTALCDYISKKYKLPNFDEGFHIALPDKTARFLEHKGNYVIKIMPDQITDKHSDIINRLVSNSFVIKLSRINVIEQIASFYICCETNKWHYKKTELDIEYKIDITDNDYPFNHIISINNQLKNLTYRYDLELTYEDLGLLDTNYKIYNKPINYVELIEMIRKKYELLQNV
jgi:hypothetical protein